MPNNNILYYVYYMLPNREVRVLRCRRGYPYYHANQEVAKNRAAYEAEHRPYTFFVDSKPDLDGTKLKELVAH